MFTQTFVDVFYRIISISFQIDSNFFPEYELPPESISSLSFLTVGCPTNPSMSISASIAFNADSVTSSE